MTEKNYRTEIVPYAFPDSNRDVCEVGIEKMSVTYVQPNDTNVRTENEPDQFLTIETESCPTDRKDALNKASYYYTIKTDRWAIEDADELAQIVNDFKDRLYHNVDKLIEDDNKTKPESAVLSTMVEEV